MTVALILITWILWTLAALGVGTAAIRQLRPDWSLRAQWHTGLWLGLALILVGSSALQILAGLGHPVGSWLSLLIIIVGLTFVCLIGYRQRDEILNATRRIWGLKRLPVYFLLLLLLIGLIDMAYLATGEPMDADAGSYRIGAILYATDYRVIPGLGNLHFRLGFNSSLWPFGALVGNGLWDREGFRLVTGIFLTTMVADIFLRTSVPRREGSLPGDWFMVTAVAFTGGIILTDAGRWVPSPGQDVAYLVLGVASTAFLADFVRDPRTYRWTSSAAIVCASAAASIRPLGWVLVASTVLVVGLVLRFNQRSSWQGIYRTLSLAGIFLIVTLLVAVIRDLILTGWILYPFSILSFPVPWLTLDGQVAQEGITAYARAPGGDQLLALTTNDWIAPWVTAFLASREFFFLRLMVLGALLPILWPQGRRAWQRELQPMGTAMIPSIILLATWFITAPDVRFGWAALLGVCALPGAYLLAANAYPLISAKVLGVTALAVMMTTQVLNGRFTPRGGDVVARDSSIGPIQVTLTLAPPPTPGAVSGSLGDGTPAYFPAFGGNCYDIFPVCLLPGSGTDIQRLGVSIQDGFKRTQNDRFAG